MHSITCNIIQGSGIGPTLWIVKQIVLHRPHPSRLFVPQSIEDIEQVLSAKLLGVIFKCTFSFVDVVSINYG